MYTTITDEDYKGYHNEDAPKDLSKLLRKADNFFSSNFTTYHSDISLLNDMQEDCVKHALLEQAEYINVNRDAFNFKSTQGFSVGRWSKAGQNPRDIKEIPQISDSAKLELNKIGFASHLL